MKIAGRVTALLAAALMCIVLLITAVQWLALGKGFYHAQHQQLNTAEQMGMSESDLSTMMDVLIDYLVGARADIAVQVEVDGIQRPAYDERETEHMVDVLALLNDALAVRNMLIMAAAVLMAISLFTVARGRLALSSQLKFILLGVLVGTLAIAGVAAAAASNFDAFWTAFHLQFFSNDLWMLDPSVSLMINMLPGKLFFALVMRIAMAYFVVAALAILACGFGMRVSRRKELANG